MIGRPPSFSLLLLVFVATVFLYSFHRVIGLKKVAKEGGARHEWARKNLWLGRSIPILAAIAGCLLAFWAPLGAVLLLLPAGGLSLSYSLPVFPVKGRWLRLRDLPGAKVFIIAAVVAYVTVFIPLIGSGGHWVAIFQNMGPWWLHRFLFILAITIPFDIRDYNLDLSAGLKTIPTSLGLTGAKVMASLALVGFAVLSWGFYLDGELPAWPFLLSASVVFPLILLAHPKRSEYYYSLLLEGSMVLQWGALWLVLA